jgi:DNA-directed RNA polymerase specialized sigma24 family protein
MKTIEDIYEELKQWGMWQRSIERSGLDYTLMKYDANFIVTTSNVKPIYRDEKSECLDRIISAFLTKEYRVILSLSFVEQKSNLEAALKMELSQTTFKAKRREAMSILIGLDAANRLDRSTAFY